VHEINVIKPPVASEILNHIVRVYINGRIELLLSCGLRGLTQCVCSSPWLRRSAFRRDQLCGVMRGCASPIALMACDAVRHNATVLSRIPLSVSAVA